MDLPANIGGGFLLTLTGEVLTMTAKEWLDTLHQNDYFVVTEVLDRISPPGETPIGDLVGVLEAISYHFGGSYQIAILDAIRNGWWRG